MAFNKHIEMDMDIEVPLKFEGVYFGSHTDSDFCEPFFLDRLQEFSWEKDYINDSIETTTMSEVIGRLKSFVTVSHVPFEELMEMAKLELGS